MDCDEHKNKHIGSFNDNSKLTLNAFQSYAESGTKFVDQILKDI